MALLLLFEKSESLSYDELRETTNIQAEAFPRHVQSLLDSKLLLCNTEVRKSTFLHWKAHWVVYLFSS